MNAAEHWAFPKDGTSRQQIVKNWTPSNGAVGLVKDDDDPKFDPIVAVANLVIPI